MTDYREKVFDTLEAETKIIIDGKQHKEKAKSLGVAFCDLPPWYFEALINRQKFVELSIQRWPV